MPEVKIFLEPGEDEVDAQNALIKALDLQASGDTHLKESFEDPAMVDISDYMKKVGEDIYEEMIEEINNELDKEYF